MNLKFFGQLLLILISVQQISAQFPTVGFPTREEMNLKVCPIDKDADAVILLHEAVSNYDDDYKLITKHHYRIKILKEKGLEYSDIEIPFYSENDFEIIGNITGFTINQLPDGNLQRVPLERKMIFTEKTSKYIHHVKFAFPGTSVGSILDYEFTSTMKHWGGLEQWHFQSELPTLLSKYELFIVPNAEFSYVVNADPNKVKINNVRGSGKVDFEMRNIPGLVDEPYMDARKDYLQRVDFQLAAVAQNNYKKKYMSSWKDVIRELNHDQRFGTQLNKSLEGSSDFLKLAKIAPPFERMKMVLDYVKRQMSWDGYIGIYSRGVKEAWAKKSGTVSDINLALVNLLQSADLEASPMLVSERRHGRVNPQIPFLDQFNKVMAHVEIDGKTYILDATDKYLPVTLYPSSILNTNALVLKRKDGGIVTISDQSGIYKLHVGMQLSLSADSVKGNASCQANEYAKMEKLAAFRTNPEGYVNGYRRVLKDGSLTAFESENELTDSLPYKNVLRFTAALQGSGDYRFLSTNLFTGMESNPFVSDARFSNINFGSNKIITSNVHVMVPENMKVDVIPKSVRLVMPDGSMSFTQEYLNDANSPVVLIRTKFESRESFYPAESYPAVKDFYKKMHEMLSEQIVLKKL
ncbi:MAG: DUF3857 domain-containing protein [Flavitalea sp.]